ncbi:GlsB/YeaQ/YmgE family stress response membrane protein [Caldimonas sp. KR1-144]|uniref:GlsB/YeaQ/YmgE family stress response membrane protein n=1 Tax=Caldimonas sp. KR1-144 TaxID=3400911 RepID=UPI003BFD818F
MHYLWMAVIGFVVGLIARAILPGSQSLGIILTTVLGIVGSLVAGFIGQALGLYAAGAPVGFIASVLGAVLVLWIYGKVKRA